MTKGGQEGFKQMLPYEKKLKPIFSENGALTYMLIVAMSMVVIAINTGVPMVLGALSAGLIGSMLKTPTAEQRAALKSFSFSFFIPIYFAFVGFRLNLVRDFEPLFFVLFLIVASLTKSLSVYLSARAVGTSRNFAKHLAVVLNARGGPGIVLASVSLDAGIIDGRLYSSLVCLALVTSFIAGCWLSYHIKTGTQFEDANS